MKSDSVSCRTRKVVSFMSWRESDSLPRSQKAPQTKKQHSSTDLLPDAERCFVSGAGFCSCWAVSHVPSLLIEQYFLALRAR